MIDPEKKRFSIKEVADLLKESEPTLRYWENEFPEVIVPDRKGRGVRSYKEKDIEDLRMIKYLVRDCGLTLEGARKKMKTHKEEAQKKAKIMQHLHSIRDELKGLVKAMNDAAKCSGFFPHSS